MTTGTLEEIYWENVLPHPAYGPDMARRDFLMFGPIIEALGGNRFRAGDEIELLVQRWMDDQPQTLLKGAQ
jgi:hypothetical protein